MSKELLEKTAKEVREAIWGKNSVQPPIHIPPQVKFGIARREMSEALIERNDEVDLVLTALIAQENPLLVGPPGTGKSMLLDALLSWMGGSVPKFSRVLTKFTVPEELFGPISVVGLKADHYRRITTGRLPEAHLAFLDEIFKASSAILNTMLRILNERVYENEDGSVSKTPLRICVSASNEWGEGTKELSALFDRFLLRKKVLPIRTAAGKQRLRWERDHSPKFSQHITTDELDIAHNEALALKWTVDAKEAFNHICEDLLKEGINPGDRRQYKAVTVAQAHAYLCGAKQVEAEHLTVLAHVLWDDPTEQPEKCMRVVLKNATPMALVINDILLTVDDVAAKATPVEAVPKLQSIQKELNKLQASPAKDKALKYVSETIKELYQKVIGTI